MVIHKSFNDFVLFLYIHMAFADGEFHPLERKVILEKMTKLFPEESNLAERLDRSVTEYHGVEKQGISQLISDTFKEFHNIQSSLKYRIYTDMYDIIHADGKVDESETQALNELKQVINLGSARG